MKKQWKNKGSVLPLTLVMMMLIFTLITFFVGYFEHRNFYIKNYVENIIKEDEGEKVVEYLMTKMNSYVYTNIDKLEKDGVNKFFTENFNDTLINYGVYKVTYNKNYNYFVINIQSRIYKFIITIDENKKVKYRFLV